MHIQRRISLCTIFLGRPVATEDLAMAIYSVAILGVCHDDDEDHNQFIIINM